MEATPVSQGQHSAAVRPTVVFVVGLGRSGTSALTRVLSLTGATLPGRLLGATIDNPRGYFEPRAAIALNQAILHRHGSSGYDPTLRAQEDGAMGSDERAEWVDRISRYLGTLPAAPVVVLKEPKITSVSGLWFEAARRAGFEVAAIIALRHPGEVIDSLDRRGGRQFYVRNSPELTAAWWLRYTLLAERATRGITRVIVDYDNLLTDWRQEVKRISVALGVDLPASDGQAVDGFLSAELRHHHEPGPVTDPFGTDWLSTVYGVLAMAARDDVRDEEWERAELDRVYESYRAAERGFRTALAGYGRYRNLNWLLAPTVVRSALGIMAIAHRRRGTWA